MSKKKKTNPSRENTVRSINNNVRSSVRKLNPILKAIVGKKVDRGIGPRGFDLPINVDGVWNEIGIDAPVHYHASAVGGVKLGNFRLYP